MKIPRELYIEQFEFTPVNSEDELENKICKGFSEIEYISFVQFNGLDYINFYHETNNFNPSYFSYNKNNKKKYFHLSHSKFNFMYNRLFFKIGTGFNMYSEYKEKCPSILEQMFKVSDLKI